MRETQNRKLLTHWKGDYMATRKRIMANAMNRVEQNEVLLTLGVSDKRRKEIEGKIKADKILIEEQQNISNYNAGKNAALRNKLNIDELDVSTLISMGKEEKEYQKTRQKQNKAAKRTAAAMKRANKKNSSIYRYKQKNQKQQRTDFYSSREWRDLRYQALKKYGRRCMCCGASPETGAVMHVDHIKPRSRFPELELDMNNLQILCEDCNLGKSNTDSIDYRATQEGAQIH